MPWHYAIRHRSGHWSATIHKHTAETLAKVSVMMAHFPSTVRWSRQKKPLGLPSCTKYPLAGSVVLILISFVTGVASSGSNSFLSCLPLLALALPTALNYYAVKGRDIFEYN